MKYLAPASWLGLLYSAGWHTAVAPDIGSIGEQIVVVGQTQHYSDGLGVRYRLGYCTHLGGTIPPVLIINHVEPRGHMDLIADFAYRLPVTVICDMLGIPEGDREIFHASSRTGGRLLDLAPLSPAEIQQQNAFNLSMADYFQQLFELRRHQPGDDLTTHLVQAEEAGDKLTNEELTANIILLFGAGHETTVNLIGNGLLALHRNPDQLRLLRDDPSLAPNAVEELLRYDSSVQVTGRTTLEDVDEIGGIPLAKGQSVVCLLGSANRDPAVYADPDKLDIRRTDIRPLSFGGGIHYCVGAQLARLEGEIAINTLLRRLPSLRHR